MIDTSQPTQVGGLKRKIVSSLSVLIIREFCIKVLAFIGQLFLTRILIPEDFGVFAIIAFIVNFSGLFADIGLQWSIIQREEHPSEQELSSIFFLKLFLSFIVIIVVFFAAPLLAYIYPTLSTANILMVQIFAVTILISALRSVPAMLLERGLKYNALSVTEVLGVVVYQVTSILLAMQGYGAWSLLWGVIAKELTEVIVVCFYNPWLPKAFFSFTKIKQITRFGIFMQGNAILNFIHASLVPVFVGISRGPYAVGILDWAQGIAAIPNTITDNYGRVAFTGFARIQQDKQLLTNAIAKSMSILAVLTLIFTVMILGFGRELVVLLFTEKWLDGVPILYWFGANTFFIAAMSSLGAGILVSGHSKKVFIANICIKVTEWLIVLALLPLYDYLSIAIASTFTSAVAFIIYVYIGKKIAILPDLKTILAPKIAIVCCTLSFIFVMKSILPENTISLMIQIASATLVYCLLVFYLSRKDVTEGISVVKHYLHSD